MATRRSRSTRRILIIDGHPDGAGRHFIHALAESCEGAARAAGHECRRINVGSLEVPPLRGNEEFLKGRPTAAMRQCQRDIAWADHLVILYPLWLGAMPGLLKSFFEQVLRPDFAFAAAKGRGLPRGLLKGRSARIIVTMGMPALFYRWFYRGHSLKSLERNILAFCGVGPVRASLVGMVEDAKQRERWLTKVAELGRRAV